MYVIAIQYCILIGHCKSRLKSNGRPAAHGYENHPEMEEWGGAFNVQDCHLFMVIWHKYHSQAMRL